MSTGPTSSTYWAMLIATSPRLCWANQIPRCAADSSKGSPGASAGTSERPALKVCRSNLQRLLASASMTMNTCICECNRGVFLVHIQPASGRLDSNHAGESQISATRMACLSVTYRPDCHSRYIVASAARISSTSRFWRVGRASPAAQSSIDQALRTIADVRSVAVTRTDESGPLVRGVRARGPVSNIWWPLGRWW